MRAGKVRELLLGEVSIPAEYLDSIRRKRLRRFQHMSSIASIFSLFAAVLLTVVFWNGPTMPAVTLWCAASGLLAFLKLRESAGAAPSGRETLDKYERVATRHTIITGAVWGVLMASLIASADPHLDWFLGLLSACIVCLGAFLHSSFPRAAVGYSALIAAGVVLGLTAGDRMSILESVLLFGGSFLALQRFAAMNYANLVRREMTSLQLAESNETISLLLSDFESHSADWLWRTNANGCIVQPSERFAEAAGMEPRQLQGVSLTALMANDSARNLETLMQDRRQFGELVVEINCADGSHWWSLSGKPTPDGGYRGVCSDITRRRKAEASLAFIKEFDELTGLPNRAMLIQKLDAAAQQAQHAGGTYALFHIDLDNFKSVNDTMGHKAGDTFLKQVAERLQSCMDERLYIARLGGDEFAVLGVNCDREEAAEIGDLFLDALLAPVRVNGQDVLISGSVGAAIAPDDGTEPALLMKNAELALYRAKAQGRGCARFFEPSMDEDARSRAEMESGLRAALANDSMDVYFQPLVNTRTGEVSGYETLLRWNRPGHGLVSPATFIACAEETGIIVPLGEWVIRKATQEAAEWKDEVTVAINLSPTQMSNPALVSTVMQALASSQLDPARLEIEITETVLMYETEQNLRTLHALRNLGVRIALDDFGTGFSSLNYLRAFPFDKLKIDQCFVRDIETSPENQAIVRSVVTLARDLGMNITAEGVENEQQATILASLGCQQVQGYLYSRPVPASELVKKPQHEIPARKVLHIADHKRGAVH